MRADQLVDERGVGDVADDQAAAIVRQVGDLRRMVDEFSSFARMPKPEFAEEAIVDTARAALFLHEVAHPTIAFTLDAPDPSPMLVCDRRQLGQALTNLVKNARTETTTMARIMKRRTRSVRLTSEGALGSIFLATGQR